MIKNKQIKVVTIGIIILLLGVSILPSVSSTNITISQNARISKTVIRVDDDGDGDYSSIQDAIDNVTNGDIIEVYSGTYVETGILVNKQLILQGIDSELGGGGGTGKPIIITDKDDKHLIIVTADGCSISGFHLKTTGCCSTGIEIQRSDYNKIFQNDVEHINFGIVLSQSSYNRVYENNVQYTFYAIIIGYYSQNNLIYDNYVYDQSYGVRVSGKAENNIVYNNTAIKCYGFGVGASMANNNTFFENTIIDGKNGVGLWKEDGHGYGMTVYGNNITSCDIGIMVTGNLHKIYQNNITNCNTGIRMDKIETLPPVQCCQNKVYENNIIGGETGIWLKGVYTSDIYRSNITGCEDEGLYLLKAEINNIFENNIINNNDDGIRSLSSENNVIYHNNFIGNPVNAYSYGSETDRRNTWNLPLTKDGGGNYWDDYNGVDKNGDNIGDKPYRIPDSDFNPFNNDVDRYPLMEPGGRPNAVTIPRDKASNNVLLLRLLERFPLLREVLLRLNPR